MNDRQSPLFWSFPAGTWFATQVRISVYLPLLVLVLCVRLGLELGAAFGAVLIVSVLLHEFGHVVAARLTGGTADEILLWPLGGLASTQPAHTVGSRLMTSAAGPLVNLVLCLIAYPAVYNEGLSTAALNPFVLPMAELSKDELLRDFLLLTFAANWLMLLINLIPVYPLDGGQMLQTVLASRLGAEAGLQVAIRVGFVCAFVMMFVGVMVDSSWAIFIGAFLLIMNMYEAQQMRAAESYDDSFMGYDFSQGYTSLEKSVPVRPEPRPGLFRRIRNRWRDKRELREIERQQQIEVQLDAILEKIHQGGYESLSESEKKVLRRASDRFRNKEKKGD